MAKLAMEIQINPKPANMKHQRRFSTGNSNIKISTEQKPIPNYLKAPTGSCHDLCKYGARRDFPAQSISSKQDRTKTLLGLEARSNPNYRGKTRNPVVSSRQQLKPKSNRTLLKSSSNVQRERNDAGKSVIPVRVSTSMSSLEIEGLVEKTEDTSYEDVPEKIIHVVESSYEIQNDDHKQDYDSSATKMQMEKEKSLEIENVEAGLEEIIALRRVASDGEIDRKETVSTSIALRHQVIEQKETQPDLNAVIEKTANKLAKMNRSRVKALVVAFETLINSKSSSGSVDPA